MPPSETTVSVGGGIELDRAGLAALIGSLPGLRLVPLVLDAPPQVLVWQARAGEMEELPPLPSGMAILLLVEDTEQVPLSEQISGLFSRNESPSALGSAIRQVARGEQYLSPSLAVALLQKRRPKSPLTDSQTAVIQSLTDREREILGLLAQGLSNKAIAAKLYLSVRTIEGHLASIYARLGVHSRTEAILLAVQIR